MHKKLLGIVLGISSMAPMASWALGLGEMNVLSKPGEPFRALIPVRSVTADQLENMQVRLAPGSAFDSLGIQRSATVDSLNFRIRAGSTPMVVVSSARPLQSGTVRFLLELEWGSGKLVKEYATSVDAIDSQPAIVSSPLLGAPSTMPMPSQSAMAPSAPVGMLAQAGTMHGAAERHRPRIGASSAAQSWARVPVYGPVTGKDKLYTIAERMRRDSSLNIGQVMAALYKHNPQAFNGNPNSLKPGAILKAPLRSQVASISNGEAMLLLRPQAAANHVGAKKAVASSAVAGKAASEAGAGPANSVKNQANSLAEKTHKAAAPLVESKPQPTGSLHLTAPQQNGKTLGAAGENNAEVAADVKTLQELNAAVKKQNELLAQRVDGLGKQVQEQHKLILDLQNRKIQTVMQAPAQAQESLLKNPLILLLVGSNALLLLLAFWLMSRMRKTNAELAATYSLAKKAVASEEPRLPRKARRSEKAGEANVPETQAGTQSEPAFSPAIAAASAAAGMAADAALAYQAKPQAALAEPAMSASLAPEIDVLEQADLYLNYGRIQPAQEVLEAALISQAGRKEIYVKLLDIYVQQGNMDDYLDLAERMRGRFGKDNGAWRSVAAQGAMLFPDNALFADENVSMSREPMRDTDMKFAALDMPGEEVKPTASPLSADADFLDFDMGATDSQPVQEKDTLEFTEPFMGETSMEADALHLDFSLDKDEGEMREDIFAALDREFKALEESPARDTDFPEQETLASLDNVIPIDFASVEKNFAYLEDAASFADADPQHAASTLGSVDWDTLGTKLDLAKAYVDMGDGESARELLEEVARDGNPQMRVEAQQLLTNIG